MQEIVVFALLEAQDGHKHKNAKPLARFHGAGVLEIALRYKSDAYRVIYTLDLAGVVYVLHAFKKKSVRGIATRREDIALIEQRLRTAAQIHEQRRNT